MALVLIPARVGAVRGAAAAGRGGWAHTRTSSPTAIVSTSAQPAQLVQEAAAGLGPLFSQIDARTEHNMRRVLDVFRKHNVGPHHFAGVDGYGNGDLGREALDQIYAELMGAEAALVRVQIFSGTHAIACALFGVLRPGDEMLAVSGICYPEWLSKCVLHLHSLRRSHVRHP